MKIHFLLVLTFGLAALSSCSKKSSSDPAPEPENRWQYANNTFKAVFSEINARSGFQITFKPEGSAGLTQGISFQFLKRPSASGNYTVSKNLSGANQVKIILETGTTPDHYGINSPVNAVSTSIANGKITFTGAGIKVVRDTTLPAYADTLLLSFNLTEF